MVFLGDFFGFSRMPGLSTQSSNDNPVAYMQHGAAHLGRRIRVPTQLDDPEDQQPESVPPPGLGGPAEQVEVMVIPNVKLVVKGASARHSNKVAGEQGHEQKVRTVSVLGVPAICYHCNMSSVPFFNAMNR